MTLILAHDAAEVSANGGDRLVVLERCDGTRDKRLKVNVGRNAGMTHVRIINNRYCGDSTPELVEGVGNFSKSAASTSSAAAGSCRIGADVTVNAGGSYEAFTLMLDCGETRDETSITLEGEGARCEANAIALLQGREKAAVSAAVVHAASGCRSVQNFRAVADGKASASFAGRVTVGREVRRAEADQQSRFLLLSREALVEASPELDILADDVQCSHGSATGNLDEDAVFYLRSRGISEDDARKILIGAFVHEMVDRISSEELRGIVRAEIGKRL